MIHGGIGGEHRAPAIRSTTGELTTASTTDVMHSSVTTALVFVAAQFMAFTVLFNKTYVSAIRRSVNVPTKALAVSMAAEAVSEADVREVAAMCAEVGATEDTVRDAAAEYSAKQPSSSAVIYPEALPAAMVAAGFPIMLGVFKLRHGQFAQPLLNGAFICMVFTALEIAAWLVVKVPNLQTKIDKALTRNVGNLRAGPLDSLVTASRVTGSTGLISEDAYSDTRRHEDLIASRQHAWVASAGVMLSLLAAVLILRAGGVARLSYRHAGREVVLTAALIGVAQVAFFYYANNYPYYGTDAVEMEEILLQKLCSGVGGEPTTSMMNIEPTLGTAFRAADADIPNSERMRTIAKAYAGAFILLTAWMVHRHGLGGAFTRTTKAIAVACLGWVTEAYIYRMVIDETVFVTWSGVESSYVEAKLSQREAVVEPPRRFADYKAVHGFP
jgi:hypothetical protein